MDVYYILYSTCLKPNSFLISKLPLLPVVAKSSIDNCIFPVAYAKTLEFPLISFSDSPQSILLALPSKYIQNLNYTQSLFTPFIIST